MRKGDGKLKARRTAENFAHELEWEAGPWRWRRSEAKLGTENGRERSHYVDRQDKENSYITNGTGKSIRTRKGEWTNQEKEKHPDADEVLHVETHEESNAGLWSDEQAEEMSTQTAEQAVKSTRANTSAKPLAMGVSTHMDVQIKGEEM